jgi:hypothetical protein
MSPKEPTIDDHNLMKELRRELAEAREQQNATPAAA